MIELRKKRLLEEDQCATEPAPSVQQNTPTSQLRSGAANTSTGKYVAWAKFKAGRHPDDTPSKRSAPMPEDSEDGSDEEVDDQGITMGPMGDAPVQRMAEENLKAAVKFVEQLGNVECAQRHFDDATITGTQSDVDDYTASIAASSMAATTADPIGAPAAAGISDAAAQVAAAVQKAIAAASAAYGALTAAAPTIGGTPP
jgi:hypothetical protein